MDTDSLEERVQQRISQRNALELTPNLEPHGDIPNTPLAAATIAFALGGLCSLSFATFAIGGFHRHWFITPQLGLFLAAWSFFHWAEFAVTAGWNLEKCSVDSFLLNNGSMYHIAHGTALIEYLLGLYLKPSLKTHPYITGLGVCLVLGGQALRSFAMIHASTNFSHAVARKKRDNHQLVSDGIYAWFRHPSYAGFFYWALGTQLVLQNPISFILYSVLLWKFFYHRIRGEERALVTFFGQQYIDYRERVGTRIPFIA